MSRSDTQRIADMLEAAAELAQIVRRGHEESSLVGRDGRAQLRGYVDRVVDRDMVEAGLRVRKEAALRGWMAACAAATSSVAS